MRSKITSICSCDDDATVPSRRAPTCPLQNRTLALGGTSMACAALCEWAQIRSLSVWTVNMSHFPSTEWPRSSRVVDIAGLPSYYERAHTFSRALPQRGPREPFSLPMRRISLSPFNSLKITPQTKHVGRPLRRRLVSFPHRTHGFLGMVFRATLSYPFSIAANARSVFSTLRRSAADSSANPPAARSFSKSASFCSAVPCISRNSVSKNLFPGLRLLLFPQHRNLPQLEPQLHSAEKDDFLWQKKFATSPPSSPPSNPRSLCA